MTDDPKDLVHQLESLLEHTVQAQTEILEDTVTLQVTLRTLLQHEGKRLERKLGQEHPRVQRINTGLKRNLEIGRDLGVERDIARIRVPEAPDKGALIHGRVVDRHSRGLMNLTVFGEDANEHPIRLFGTATTDASGHYIITLDPKTFNRLQDSEVFLTVRSRTDKVLHREAKPLELISDSQQLADIVLETGFRPDRFIKVTESVVKPKKEPEVRLEKLKGIGPKRAEKLREAGIKDLQTFAAADDGMLREILDGTDIRKLKEDNAELLKMLRRAEDET